MRKTVQTNWWNKHKKILRKKNISKPAIYSCKPTMPLPRKTSMPRQWNAASMPAPSTIGRITIKKLLNCCAVPSKWWQPANRKRARPCPTYVSASTRNACRCTSTWKIPHAPRNSWPNWKRPPKPLTTTLWATTCFIRRPTITTPSVWMRKVMPPPTAW